MSTEIKSKEIKSLGYQNGWQGTPEIVKACEEARRSGENHDMAGSTPYRCVHRTTCYTCGYTYLTDSGD